MIGNNTQLHAAFLYWLYTRCPRDKSKSSRTYVLLENFNRCMEETGLAPKLGCSAFKLLLDYSDLDSYEENGFTYWIGVHDEDSDPLDMDRYYWRSFPEIFR